METRNDTRCPQEVLDWIAWYPDGLLPERMRGTIEAHAAECARCRAEIEMLATGEAQEPEVAIPDPDQVFGRILSRIEDEAARRRTPAPPKAAPKRATRGRTLRRSAMAAALAMVFAAGAVGAGMGAWLSADTPAYRTATATAEAGPRLDAVFREDAPFGLLESGLREIGGNIVSGPSAGGRVQIALPAASDPEVAAARLREALGESALLVEPALR